MILARSAPPPLIARLAIPADYPHFVRLFPELGVDDPILEAAHWQRAFAPSTLFFELEGASGSAVVAYAYFEVMRGVGYVRHIVVDPALRGRGLGRAVMDTLAARFREAGCSQWCLNVKPDNLPALRLYRSVGMTEAFRATAFRFPWDLVDRLPRSDRAVIARVSDPAEDAAIEAAFDLSPGQIAAARARPDHLMIRLVDPAAPDDARVGFASFAPKFPGAHPFRVADASLARPLLEALRSYAVPELPYMQAFVEDQPELVRLLIDAGATVRLEAIHLRGAIP